MKNTPRQILFRVSIWPFVALILLPVALLSAWDGYRNYLEVMQHEYSALEENSKQREAHISGSIRIINQILLFVKNEYLEKRHASPVEQSQAFRNFLKTTPEIRNLVLVNGQGKVQAEAKDISIGQDVSTREYFLHHQKAPGDDTPFFAKPFVSKAGNLVLTISRVVRSESGEFLGVILASFDEQYLERELKLQVNQPGIEAALINRQGDVISIIPHDALKKNVADSVAYKQHFSSNEQSTRHLDRSAADGIERISVYTDINESPLTVIVSKQYGRLLTDWLNSLYGNILTFILLTLAIVYLAKVLLQRQHTIDAAWQEISNRDIALTNFKSIVSSTQDAVIGCDLTGQINTWNQGAETIFGYQEHELIGSFIERLVSEDRRAELKDVLIRITRGERVSHFDTQSVHKSGAVIDIEATISPMLDENSKVMGAALIARDVTEKKAYEARLSHMASHDRLTNLPNRELFYDRLSQAISLARRNHYRLAVMFLDLDGFKGVNDMFGHSVGDATLKVAAARLIDCFRDTDTVARLGGDEFAVILTEIQTEIDVGGFANKLINSIGQPMPLKNGEQYGVGASIGIALYPDAGSEIDGLIQAADNAMYESKSRGKNRYTFATKVDPDGAFEKRWISIGEDLKVGIPVVDEQHLELANMLSDLNLNLASYASTTVVMHQLDEIVVFVTHHFDTEDRLMTESNYPDAHIHRRAHGYLLSELKYLKVRFTQGGELYVLKSLKDWLIKHIETEDKLFGMFVNHKN